MGVQAVMAAAVAAQLFAMQLFFGRTLSTGAAGIGSLVVPLLAFAGLGLAFDVLRSIESERTRLLAEHVARITSEQIIDVTSAVDLVAFDDPAFHDSLQRAQTNGGMRLVQAAQALVGLAGALMASTGLIAVVSTLNPLLLVGAGGSLLPIWWTATRNIRETYTSSLRLTTNDRMRAYFQQLLSSKAPAKEVRAFDLAPYLRSRLDDLQRQRIDELRAAAVRRVRRTANGALVSAAYVAAVLSGLAVVYQAGRLTLPVVATSFFAFYQLSARLGQCQFNLASLAESAVFIDDFTSFVRVPHRTPRRSLPKPFRQLELSRVSFSYPNSDRRALSEISLSISAGEVIALVGENGSGKTTLAKIIGGGYVPLSGEILWNGSVVTADDRGAGLRAETAFVFQDFERYFLTAAENIVLGDAPRGGDVGAMEEAARIAGADSVIRSLPDQYRTVLGTQWTGGHEMSIGQWQRVALARAVFRNAAVVVLDEPSSALDPRAEAELFDSVREVLAGRTAIVISHRLSSVRAADYTYVLADGCVIEQGAHDDLVRRGGVYAELFALQARHYLPTASSTAE